LLREEEVEKAIREYLKRNAFDVKERTAMQGVDIFASKNGKSYYVEVEGNRKPNGAPLTTAQKYTHLLRAVGQICLRMNEDPDGEFILGLPEDDYYRNKVEKLATALKKLNVKVFFVKGTEPVAVTRWENKI